METGQHVDLTQKHLSGSATQSFCDGHRFAGEPGVWLGGWRQNLYAVANDTADCAFAMTSRESNNEASKNDGGVQEDGE